MKQEEEGNKDIVLQEEEEEEVLGIRNETRGGRKQGYRAAGRRRRSIGQEDYAFPGTRCFWCLLGACYSFSYRSLSR